MAQVRVNERDDIERGGTASGSATVRASDAAYEQVFEIMRTAVTRSRLPAPDADPEPDVALPPVALPAEPVVPAAERSPAPALVPALVPAPVAEPVPAPLAEPLAELPAPPAGIIVPVTST